MIEERRHDWPDTITPPLPAPFDGGWACNGTGAGARTGVGAAVAGDVAASTGDVEAARDDPHGDVVDSVAQRTLGEAVTAAFARPG